MLAPLGCKPLQERHVWAELQLRWSVEWGGAGQVRLHLHFTAIAAAAAAAEPQKLKRQAVWVRMHLQGRRGRGEGGAVLRALPPQKEVPKFTKFANFLNFSGASQKLNARKLIILIILAPRKK